MPVPATGSSPVVLLSYPHGGAETVTRMLAGEPSLACTTATGIVPLCHLALQAWQQAEGTGPPSGLAVKSVRALATQMITIIQAGYGATRWCETAYASPSAVASFRQIFPGTTFVCLHRGLSSVLGEAAGSYPWGLGGSPFWPYSGAHPGNNAATVAAFWAACTEQLLDIETQFPDACLRVRHEDLAGQGPLGLAARLGLDGTRDTAPAPPDPAGPPDLARPLDAANGSAGPGPLPPLPAGQLPAPLLAKVADLNTRLGYPALAA
jgi:hypothetical protein